MKVSPLYFGVKMIDANRFQIEVNFELDVNQAMILSEIRRQH